MEKSFDFKGLEPKIYRQWEDAGAFTPKIEEGKKPYTMIMPPPNAYDKLHIGHALFVTLEDVMVRYHRLKGEPTLWLPGADHAGLGSQVFFEKLLQKERGISRFELGREKFVEELGKHMSEKRTIMEGQLRALGASCDWTRAKFTLDPDVSQAVYFTFKKMYDDGLIYRGERVINWCPKCQTGLSDIEVEHKEQPAKLYWIKYGPFALATTRPETKLGDTAVAVHPNDKRYKAMIGKKYMIPGVLGEFEITVVGDEAVNPEFGSGAVKVTPAHSLVDFEIAQRHGIPAKKIIDKRGRMMDNCGRYVGMTTGECREAIVDDMQKMGLIEKIDENYQNSVAAHDKCGHVVEPMLLEQWFVKIAPLAKPALEVVKQGRIKFIPERFEKTYTNWMENIRDWNISRQVWWGHQVPVYYLKNGHEKFVVAENEAEAKKILGGDVEQDSDTLDTWFSSGLWPFTTLGWPKETADFKYFYPTTMMETGWDIIFFWVARMIMLGLYCTGKPPFELVYMNGLVRDQHGQKISKSKGNVIDPLVMVEKYGADALRMGLMVGTAAGNDTNISEDKIRAYRNFANKIWNAARFVSLKQPKGKGIDEIALSTRDKEVLKEFDKMTAELTKMMDKYQLGQAGELAYDYFWHTFCDKIIEEYKEQLEDEDRKEAAGAVLHHILKNSLVMLHPFVPFATEAVWQELYDGQLILASWPK